MPLIVLRIFSKQYPQFFTEDHKSRNCDVVVSDFDNRRITILTCSFIGEAISPLHNDNLMCQENAIEGYDIVMGKTNVNDFGEPESIQHLDPSAIPTPIDKTSKLGQVIT